MIVNLPQPQTTWKSYLKVVAIFALLYLFLVSIGLIGSAFKGLGKSFAEQLIQSSAGPLVGLFIGILATSIIQSSSTTTSLVVGMVAAGTFGEDPRIALAAAIPYIMGANIGTSITNTIVALGHIVRKDEFERAFAASIVHDFFNLFAVIILFPIQIYTNFIGTSAYWLAERFIGTDALTFNSPIKLITEPTVHLINDIFKAQELINPYWLVLLSALLMLFFALKYLTVTIRSLVISKLEAFFDTHIFKTWIRAMTFGLVITVLVQSSSITTSLVVPLAGAGILTLRQIFPYTLGSNIGTTITAILASLVSASIAPVAVAFAHLLFNIFGILIIWPIKQIRELPINMAQYLSAMAIRNRIFPLLYILIVFFLIPISLILITR